MAMFSFYGLVSMVKNDWHQLYLLQLTMFDNKNRCKCFLMAYYIETMDGYKGNHISGKNKNMCS